jgi:glutathione synthase/RimK-type ligase-like ATP-grasp enzyme
MVDVMSAAKPVLLATSRDWVAGEPGHEVLDAELAKRGIAATWACWDDPAVDWSAAALVAVRSTWDYIGKLGEFLDWTAAVEKHTRLLNGADVFAWNSDKVYLAGFDDTLAVVPTIAASDRAELADAVASLTSGGSRAAVVKPRVGAGGVGVLVVTDPADPRLGQEFVDHPALPPARGPWIVQPLVESVRTAGETSVFVLGGEVTSQVDKLPGEGEIRVHEHLGGSSRQVPVDDDAAALAVQAMDAVAARFGRPLDYGRVDMMRYDGSLVVSELELIEPGLYLDVLPDNARPFADLVAQKI